MHILANQAILIEFRMSWYASFPTITFILAIDDVFIMCTPQFFRSFQFNWEQKVNLALPLSLGYIIYHVAMMNRKSDHFSLCPNCHFPHFLNLELCGVNTIYQCNQALYTIRLTTRAYVWETPNLLTRWYP